MRQGGADLRLLLICRELRQGAAARGPSMLRLLLRRGCVSVCWGRIVTRLVLLLGIGPCVAEEVRVQAVRGERHTDRWRSQRHPCEEATCAKSLAAAQSPISAAEQPR